MFDLLAADVDGGTLTGVAAMLTPILLWLGKFVRDYKNDLEACRREHAADQYKIGGLEASVRILSAQHPGTVQRDIEDTLRESNEKAEAAKAEPVAKGKPPSSPPGP